MIKIGIVSRTKCINYGANLQAIALQEILLRLGYEPEYIDYTVSVQVHGAKKILSFGYNIVKRFLGYATREKRTKRFWSEINFSQTISDKEEFKKICQEYDVLLCGSDQIWNPRYYRVSNGAYLFEGIENIKVSYASSFGVKKISGWYSEIVKRSLSAFKRVSCREDEGIHILRSLNINAVRNIDPTLLLTGDDWSTKFPPQKIIEGDYICCYVMPGADTLNKVIYRLAERYVSEIAPLCKIVVLGEKEYKGWFSKRINYRHAGPVEFLNIMKNAVFIFTSSFHGTCFSIIFRKNFHSVIEDNNQFNSRITNLLDTLNLQNRIIHSEKTESDHLFKDCDYRNIDKLLFKEKENSINYLKNIGEIV